MVHEIQWKPGSRVRKKIIRSSEAYEQTTHRSDIQDGYLNKIIGKTQTAKEHNLTFLLYAWYYRINCEFEIETQQYTS